jgi:carotenoid cleavage dioxygenase-like enzyme
VVDASCSVACTLLCCPSFLGLQAVRSFTCPTFFFFHVGNAFESPDGSCLHVDLAGYQDPQILLDLGLDLLRQPRMDAAGGLQQQVSTSGYWRLSIPLQGQDGGRLQVWASWMGELPIDRAAWGCMHQCQ